MTAAVAASLESERALPSPPHTGAKRREICAVTSMHTGVPLLAAPPRPPARANPGHFTTPKGNTMTTPETKREQAVLIGDAIALLMRTVACEHAGSPCASDVAKALIRAENGSAFLSFNMTLTGIGGLMLAQVIDRETGSATELLRAELVEPGAFNVLH